MTRSFRWVLAFWITASAAFAQNPSDSSALARELFAHGRTLMETGDYAGACAKFAESQRLDPGGGTLLNLAVCNEKLGKTATAWAEFNEAIIAARRDGRRDRELLAKEHVDALAPTLSRLTIQVPEPVRVRGLRVALNGVEMGSAAWGSPLPVDPGKQQVSVSAPGKIARTFEMEVGANADRKELAVEPLADAPKPPPERRSDATVRRAPATAAQDQARTLWPYWAVTGAMGAAAGLLTVRAYVAHNNAEDEHDRFGVTKTEYDDAKSTAKRDALIADVAWGLTAASAGVALWLTLTDEKPKSRESVRLDAGPGTVRVSGRF